MFEFRAAQRQGGGIGCVSPGHPRQLAGIRVHADDDGGAAAFQLYGAEDAQWESLSRYWWRAVDEIHPELFRIEARYLLGRVLFGPRVPAGDLLTLPPHGASDPERETEQRGTSILRQALGSPSDERERT